MYEFPFELDDFQKDACRCITDGKSVVVCAPTGAGKTVIAPACNPLRVRAGKKSFLYNTSKSFIKPKV